jgi:hypothetical protein
VPGEANEIPAVRGRLEAPREKGVYVIYSPSGRIVHVGRTPRAKGGIAQRLKDHLADKSSFTNKHLMHEGSKLRRGYTFRCLVVKNGRKRALLEALGIGRLCPVHIGLGEPPLDA